MSINWFPGHMHKARKEIAKTMDEIDVVIEVLDARLPQSSENPLVDSLRKGKPVIKLLNKSDLADPDVTAQWLAFFNAMDGVQALALDNENRKLIKRLPELCKQLVPSRVAQGRPVRAMIMGIPNVGKSTLINALVGKRIAKVGNTPAVTRHQQRFMMQGGMALSDTPGILWPKIVDPDSGYRLAASGAIRDTAIELEDVALFTAGFMLASYPQRLMERYRLTTLAEIADELLEQIGRKRGCLKPGGVVDRHKASEILLMEIRGGKLGRVSFETVAEWDEKRRQAALEEAERQAAEDEQQQDPT
ncbi:ribosome biogenesis GTPase YlqF [Marinobacterium rhizophilum]|uniref:Ribosome biogenesis GTPase A n=1 Tax=Marinobacterium rhizophilum TaxID=420402 RepID=A0ABY5HNN4_9GAMM|nr:ribosome biogenesis GTPase YlqF [Marinobacterium rhizophilum]UTW13481.1 ribosome biogenesis GTPase YlqF [Marinobacterium rhizophilum]